MGVLTSTQILAEVVFQKGWEVKKAEVHGMSQRGGSICSDVRYGGTVWSPMIPAGEVDFLVLFQEDQLPLYEGDCSPQTVILRPSDLDVERLANKKALNVALLGLLSRHLGIPAEAWLEGLRAVLPEKLYTVNEAAFWLGRKTER
jgi:indolepyruvate ferredoxin oxidoreductase beta subunit